jgi:hypothetical protein
MEFKGTKGKWRNIVLGDRNVIGNDENSTLHFIDCWLAGIGGIETNEEAKANALLISKAPEMLEMLEKVLNLNNSAKEHISEKFFSDVEQLIKEATKI